MHLSYAKSVKKFRRNEWVINQGTSSISSDPLMKFLRNFA